MVMDEQRQAIVDAYKLVPQTSDELMKDDYAIEVLRQKISVELRPDVEETRRLLLVIRKGGHLPRLREKLVQAVTSHRGGGHDKIFIYCESTEGGMDHTIFSDAKFLGSLYGWMQRGCEGEDQKLLSWLESAEVGEHHYHRLGVIIRLKDK